MRRLRRSYSAPFMALILAGCGMGQDEHQRLLDEALAQQKQAFDEEMRKAQAAHKEEMEAKQAELEGRDASLGQRGAQLEAAKRKLQASQAEIEQLRRLRAKAEKEKAQFAALTERFKAMIDAGKLEVIRRNGRMILKLPDDILFPSGSKKLKKSGQEAIIEVAKVLQEAAADREFLVAGHTDNVPVGRRSAFKSNWELSTARATEVVKLLIKNGVPAESLAAAGYGEFDPIASNDSAEGREKNRRLEIILVPRLEDLGMG